MSRNGHGGKAPGGPRPARIARGRYWDGRTASSDVTIPDGLPAALDWSGQVRLVMSGR
jgi:hypothetical protein